jgi:TPR repeat protein
MKLKCAIAAILLVSAFAAPVAAGTFEDAVDAHARGDYAKALRLIRPLANDGDASAQFNLGLMYATGQGVQQDNAAAALWFRKAAEQGYAPAQSNLGTLYLYGRGVTQDDNEERAGSPPLFDPEGCAPACPQRYQSRRWPSWRASSHHPGRHGQRKV